MDSLVSRVSYLKGLLGGLEIDKSSKDGRIFTEITDILGDMASEIEYVEESQLDMEEYLDAFDEDLQHLEGAVYDDEDDDEDDEDDDFMSVKCPNCGENIYMENDMIENGEKIECPSCGKPINVHDLCECDDCCDHK